jgi:hypothetical protein
MYMEVLPPDQKTQMQRQAFPCWRAGAYAQVTPTVFSQDIKNTEVIKFVKAHNLFQDCDALFDRFMRECSLRRIRRATGLNVKFTNTIAQPWTLRIKTNATQQDLDSLLVSGHNGSERCVEWEIR